MALNKIKPIVAMFILIFSGLQIGQLHSSVLAPKPEVVGRAELATALLRGGLGVCNQKVAFKYGKLSNRALLFGSCVNIVRIINDALAFYNASQKEDLAFIKNGKSFQQYLTCMFLLQDVVGLCANAKNLWANRTKKSIEYQGLPQQIQNQTELSSAEKLKRLFQKLSIYVLPMVESIAVTTRAVDSLNAQYGKDRLELTNYLCFVVVLGCECLSEFLQTKRGSLGQNWAIAKAIVCAATILVDLKRHDNRRVSAFVAAEQGKIAAENARLQTVQEKIVVEGQLAGANAIVAQANAERSAADDARVQAIQTAAAAEAARAVAEAARVQATQDRVLAEQQKAAAEQMAQVANEAAQKAKLEKEAIAKQKDVVDKQVPVLQSSIDEAKHEKALAEQIAIKALREKREAEQALEPLKVKELATLKYEDELLQEYLAFGLPREVIPGWVYNGVKTGHLSVNEKQWLIEMKLGLRTVLDEKQKEMNAETIQNWVSGQTDKRFLIELNKCANLTPKFRELTQKLIAALK